MCCTVCGHEMRKNHYDLGRHWESHHKDLLEKKMKPSWKVPARGASLEKHGEDFQDQTSCSYFVLDKDDNIKEEGNEDKDDTSEDPNMRSVQKSRRGCGKGRVEHVHQHLFLPH